MNNLSKLEKKNTSQSILIVIRVTHIIRFHVERMLQRECYGRTPMKKRIYIYFTIHIIYEINTPNK